MEAILFDMDGVLVESESHWKQVGCEFLREIVSHWNDELQQSIIGMSATDVHKLLAREHGLTLSREEYFAHYRTLAADVYGRRVEMMPGCREFLEETRRNSCKAGLVSASPHYWIELVLDRFALRPYFKTVVSSDDVGGRGKPDPAIYCYAADSLGVAASRCVAIEDSARGVESAKRAGMKIVGLRNGHNSEADVADADYVCEGFSGISVDLLRDLAAS